MDKSKVFPIDINKALIELLNTASTGEIMHVVIADMPEFINKVYSYEYNNNQMWWNYLKYILSPEDFKSISDKCYYGSKPTFKVVQLEKVIPGYTLTKLINVVIECAPDSASLALDNSGYNDTIRIIMQKLADSVGPLFNVDRTRVCIDSKKQEHIRITSISNLRGSTADYEDVIHLEDLEIIGASDDIKESIYTNNNVQKLIVAVNMLNAMVYRAISWIEQFKVTGTGR